MIEIDTKKFYIIGIVSFTIIALANSVSFVLTFPLTSIWNKIASVGGIIFNIAIVGFFFYLLSLEPKVDEEVYSEDIDEIIKKVKGGKNE